MSEKQNFNSASEEIDFKKLFLQFKKSFFYSLKRWYIILLCGVLCALLGIGFSIFYGNKFVTTYSFGVQSQNSTSAILSNALSLANNFGLGSKSSGIQYDNNYFATLINSRKILKSTLLDRVTFKGKKDFLANHYIQLMDLHDDWDENEALKTFSFKHPTLETLTNTEDSLLTIICNLVVQKNLEVVDDESSPLVVLTITSKNREFSKLFASAIMDNVNSFYFENVYEINSKNLELAKYRVDSIANALNMLDANLAMLKDNSYNVVKQQGLLSLNRMQRDESLLSIQYSSAVNAYEIAKTNQLVNTPILQIVDDADSASQVLFISFTKAIVIGSFIGIFFSSATLFIIGLFKTDDKLKVSSE